MAGASITLRSLAKSLGGRPVLRGVSLEAAAGDWLAVIGPSGAGKSTLLRCVAGLERPDQGQVLLDGRDAAAVAARDRGVGMVFQDLALWPYMTVEEHAPDPALRERLGLKPHDGRRPHELSGGERQRLALARALASRPRILLLDEPFASLDPLLRRGLADLIADLQQADGFTVVYVTHHFEAPVARASRVALLREGTVEQCAPLSELRSSPRNEWVAAFLADEAEVGR